LAKVTSISLNICSFYTFVIQNGNLTNKNLYNKIQSKQTASLVVCLLMLLFILLRATSLNAQTTKNKEKNENYFIETKVHYGFIIKHHKKIGHLQSGHFSAFELSAGFETFGKNSWDKLYHYPTIGCAFWYSDLAKSSYLGSAYAFYPYMKFHLINQTKFASNLRFGIGLGYLSKKFDRYNNYKGVAIGSHINAAISLLFETSWKTNSQLSINTGIGLTHFSNGAYNTPNLGINIPTLNVGSLWHLSKKQSKIIENPLPLQNKKYEFNTFIAFGVKEMYPPLSKKYFTCSYSEIFYKLNKHKSKYGLGLDFFYNTGNLTVLRLPTNDFNANVSIIRIGVSLAYEQVYNHLSFLIQTGPYIRSRDKTDGSIYTRIGLRYAISNHWYMNLSLKTHFGKADHIECGLGFKI